MPKKKNPIGKLEVAFGMTEDMVDSLHNIRVHGISQGHMVRKIVDLLDEEELAKVPEWPAPPKKRGLIKSKHYAVTPEQHAKLERLKAAGVPVYDMIRQGISFYLSMPIEDLLKDETILLYSKLQALKKSRLIDRKRRQTVDFAKVASGLLRGPILNSLGMDRQAYLDSLAKQIQNGEVRPGRGEAMDRALMRLFGLTRDEATHVLKLSLEEDPEASQVKGEFSVGALMNEARLSKVDEKTKQIIKKATDKKKERLAKQKVKAKAALEDRGFTLESVPNIKDLDGMKHWLGEAVKTGNITNDEANNMWVEFLAKKQRAEDPEGRYILDTTKHGRGYVRDDKTKELIGSFEMPPVDLNNFSAIVLPSQNVVEIADANVETFRIPLEPISSEEETSMGEALQDHAIYEMLTKELEKFEPRSMEELSEHHMTELYIAVRNKVFRAIEKGEIENFSKTDCETVLARTMKRMKDDFGLRPFGVLENEEEIDPDKALEEWRSE